MSKLKRNRIGRAPPKEAPSGSSQLPEVLYVEDERENWDITELMMRPQFHLTQAATDRAAFDLLRETPQRFKAILMDIQLRGSALDGIAITRALRGRGTAQLPDYARGLQTHNLPIIFVTAYAGSYTRQELLDAGGDEVFTKPVDFKTMAVTLSRIISQRTRNPRDPGDPSDPNAPNDLDEGAHGDDT